MYNMYNMYMEEIAVSSSSTCADYFGRVWESINFMSLHNSQQQLNGKTTQMTKSVNRNEDDSHAEIAVRGGRQNCATSFGFPVQSCELLFSQKKL